MAAVWERWDAPVALTKVTRAERNLDKGPVTVRVTGAVVAQVSQLVRKTIELGNTRKAGIRVMDNQVYERRRGN